MPSIYIKPDELDLCAGEENVQADERDGGLLILKVVEWGKEVSQARWGSWRSCVVEDQLSRYWQATWFDHSGDGGTGAWEDVRDSDGWVEFRQVQPLVVTTIEYEEIRP